MKEFKEQSPEDLRRRATRVIYRAELKGRRRLVERLTAKNAEAFEELLKTKAIFSREDKAAPSRLLIDPSIETALPQEFFNHPTRWIESREAIRPPEKQISTGGFSGSIGDIQEYEHDADVERVKRFCLSAPSGEELWVVSKRINPKWEDLHEAHIARQAHEAGLPTPRVLAEILDHGNIYVWFEFISGTDIADLYHSAGLGYYNHSPEVWRNAARRFLDKADQMRLEEMIFEKTRWEEINKNFQILRAQLAEHLRVQPDQVIAASTDPQAWLVGLYQRAEASLPQNEVMDELIEKTKSVERKNLLWKMVALAIQDCHRSSRTYFQKPQYPFSPTQEALAQWRADSHAYQEKMRLFDQAQLEIREAMPDTPYESITYHADDISYQIENMIGNAIFGDWGAFGSQERALIARYKASRLGRKELEPRNILIRWDNKNDRPARLLDGTFDLYILDWEKPDKQY